MKSTKTKLKYKYVFLIPVILLTFFVVWFFFLSETTPHPLVANQSTTKEIQNGKYKIYTNNHFKYAFEFPAGYSLVENLENPKDGYYRQTVLSKDAVYDIPKTKFVSGVVISFWFYTDQTLDQILENMKRRNDVSLKETSFKGSREIEVKLSNFPQIKRVLIPRVNGVLSIDFSYGSETSMQMIKQYEEEFRSISSSFNFID